MTSFKRTIAAASAAALLASSASYAAPLPAGKPAGTKEAALLALGPIFWIGLAALGLGLGLGLSNNKNTVTSTSTSGTGS